jgi:ABC-type enterochelin transport system permease subunit
MQKIKDRWDIKQNWQLVFPILGIFTLLFSGYALAKIILSKFSSPNLILLLFLTLILAYGILNVTLKLFKRLAIKWEVTYQWELIAIFLVFAVTGSTSTKISGPIIEFLGLKDSISSTYIFWTLRILIIFPIYQVLLVIFGWLFGQFQFFWAFEKKMLTRMGFKRFFNE